MNRKQNQKSSPLFLCASIHICAALCGKTEEHMCERTENEHIASTSSDSCCDSCKSEQKMSDGKKCLISLPVASWYVFASIESASEWANES